MSELQHIRRGLSELGFHEFARNRFRQAAGSDGVEYAVEFDLFSRHGRRRTNIVVGVVHEQLGRCLATVLLALNEPERARVIRAGFTWLLAQSISTMDLERIEMESRQHGLGPAISVGDLVRHVQPVRSLSVVVQVMNSDEPNWHGWRRRGALTGMKILIALGLLRARGASVDESVRKRAMDWVMNDAHYAPIGPDRFQAMIDRAVFR